MASTAEEIYGGVDTHGRTHHAAAVDGLGRVLGDREVPATSAGYVQLIGWLKSIGPVALVGVEGTGAYGAGLATALSEHRMQVVEVDRPDRRARRRHGKSDPLDALAAARVSATRES